MAASGRKGVLFCNRRSNKRIMLLRSKERRHRSNYNIRWIIGGRSPLYRTVIYYRDIFRCFFPKLYRVLTIRRYNHKKRPIEDPIRQCRLKYSPRCRGGR